MKSVPRPVVSYVISKWSTVRFKSSPAADRILNGPGPGVAVQSSLPDRRLGGALARLRGGVATFPMGRSLCGDARPAAGRRSGPRPPGPRPSPAARPPRWSCTGLGKRDASPLPAVHPAWSLRAARGRESRGVRFWAALVTCSGKGSALETSPRPCQHPSCGLSHSHT
ncbi:lactosylceramide 1,3-N-acetyl-beta-D-glucosaminyltransferase isoform X3 [Artibeus jamaicensis]|uniref:lactosylceramide 1,3-N-acetyl-beta-D-glucosaminyltransferase isoform X3 n=1 Tax=Artibeus jamaicensis TaxID=9417 RepID=UPI00235B0473|nr:lactosylceramide 1,3-N-acetyl-beta-D-glucosaminyltransferase isoform X3 [Artibeus jamaicensis]